MAWVRSSDLPTGVGLGLRWAFLADIAANDGPAPAPFFEVSPENYMRRGDRIPQDLERVFAKVPVITHGLMMNIGSTDELDRPYLDQLRGFLRRIGARYHSDHLCWSGGGGRIFHDLLPLPFDRGLVQYLADRIRRVQDHLGVPLAMENISYYYSPLEGMPEAEFIRSVIETADCGLMLDVNNLWVNARNHGFDPWTYLDTLPLDRVVQMHVAGGELRPKMDNLIIDTHGADVDSTVQRLMATVVERIGPVPVIYERDHNIPPLVDLARQVEVLNEVYDAALERHHGKGPKYPVPVRLWAGDMESPSLDHDVHRRIEVGLLGIIRQPNAPQDLQRDVTAALAAWGLQGDAARDLARLPAERLLVYRTLVRNGLRDTIRGFLPRTVARLGEVRFEAVFAAWLADDGPISPYLRDVPAEFAEWFRVRGQRDDAGPAYLGDLAIHEVVEAQAEAAPAGPTQPVVSTALQLDAPVVFDHSTRLVDYGHRIHELSSDLEADDHPVAEPTSLLVYRDEELDARFLCLTPLARAVLGALLVDRKPLAEGIRDGAAQVGLEVNDDLLARLALLFADLAKRGVLLGAAKL